MVEPSLDGRVEVEGGKGGGRVGGEIGTEAEGRGDEDRGKMVADGVE